MTRLAPNFHHLSDLLRLFSEEYARLPLLRFIDQTSGKWVEWTGRQVADMALATAQAFVRQGIKPGDHVALYTPNRAEGLVAELGLMVLRAVAVPLYATCSPDQVAFIAEHAEIRLILVGGQFQYNNAYGLIGQHSTLRQLVILDRSVVLDPMDHDSFYFDSFLSLGDAMPYESEVRAQIGLGTSDETAVLIYTSGTTGVPKGVLITHRMILTQVRTHQELLPQLGTRDSSVNFLPLSHAFEKLWVYFCLASGIKVVVVTDPQRIMELMPQIRPTAMCNVPRYWEKVYQGVEQHIARSSAFMRHVYQRALSVGRRYHLDYRRVGKQAPWRLRCENALYQRTVFYILKRVLGLERGRFFPTAGAPLSDSINEFLQSAGFNIVVGYGLSETAATVSFYPQSHFIIGSIGEVIPPLEVRIDPETQEIQLRGDTITPGYYRNDEATQKAFTEDGWFRTGDAGRLEGRTLYFIERIKELFKTSNGKYIAPQMIESLLSQSCLIAQSAVIADGYKFVGALIYPDYGALRQLLTERGEEHLTQLSDEELSQHEEIHALLLSHIEPLQAHLASYEKVKRLSILSHPFSVETETLTPTLKLRRRNIASRYAQEIEKMYL